MPKGERLYMKDKGGVIVLSTGYEVSKEQAEHLAMVGLTRASDIADAASDWNPLDDRMALERLVRSHIGRVSKAKQPQRQKATAEAVTAIVDAFLESPIERLCDYLSDERNRETFLKEKQLADSRARSLSGMTDFLRLSGIEGDDRTLKAMAKDLLAKAVAGGAVVNLETIDDVEELSDDEEAEDEESAFEEEEEEDQN